MADKRCPACSASKLSVAEPLRGSDFLRCASCGLQFVDPVPTGTPVFQDFTDAGQAFFESLEKGGSISESLTRAERLAHAWLQKKHAGARVLELCCESGRFLAALRSDGFQVFGTDPLERPIEMLLQRGFTVRSGLVEAVPAEWGVPSAIIVLESLVRFPEPVAFLTSIRQRFPSAALFLTVPGRRSVLVPTFDRRYDYPPHHLTRWTAKALEEALARSGYRAAARRVHVDLHVWRGSIVNRLLKAGFYSFLRLTGESEELLVAEGVPA